MSFKDELKKKVGGVAGRKEFLDFVEEKSLKSIVKIKKYLDNEIKKAERYLVKFKSISNTRDRRNKTRELAFLKNMKKFYDKNIK